MRRHTTRRVIIGAALALWGCGGGGTSGSFATGGAGGAGGSGGGAGGSGGTGGEPPLGCSSATYCGDFVCGVHAVPACGEVDCGPCRFGSETFGFGDITAAPDRSIHLVTFDPAMRELVYTAVGPGGPERETVAPDVRAEKTSIAVATDGTVHVAYIDTQVMHAVKRPGDPSFSVAVAADAGEAVSVVVDAADAPHLIVTGEHPQTRQRQLLHVTESGGTYTGTPVPDLVPIGTAAVARGEDGSIALAVRSELTELAVLELEGDAFRRDTTVPALDDQPAEWSIVKTSDGIRVTALLGNYTLITGSKLILLSRKAGTWTLETLGGAQVTHGIALARGPEDALHLGYFARREDGLFYTRPGSPRRLNVNPECDDGDVRIAIDADDQPHLVYRCDSDGQYMAPIERYSDEYLAACSAAATSICDRACACGKPDCCYNDGSGDGSNGCFFGPNNAGHTLCVADMKIGLCGDLTADPAALLACKPVLDADAAACFESGYTIPEACRSVMQASF